MSARMKKGDCGNKGGYYGNQPWMYSLLGSPRHEFVKLLNNKLADGMSSAYTAEIAEKIADDVALAIFDPDDQFATNDNWTEEDLRKAIGRVLLKAVENTYNEEI